MKSSIFFGPLAFLGDQIGQADGAGVLRRGRQPRPGAENLVARLGEHVIREPGRHPEREILAGEDRLRGIGHVRVRHPAVGVIVIRHSFVAGHPRPPRTQPAVE
jgi:hypothetical protein